MKKFLELTTENTKLLNNEQFNELQKIYTLESAKDYVQRIDNKDITWSLLILTEDYTILKSKQLSSTDLIEELESDWNTNNVDFDLAEVTINYLVTNIDSIKNEILTEKAITNLVLLFKEIKDSVNLTN